MTTDLSKFGYVQQEEAAKMMIAIKNGWPDDFDLVDVKLCIDADYGDVYFTNDLGEFAALTDSGKIESYYFSPTGKYKGFFEDLKNEYANMEDIGDMNWFKEIAERLGHLEEILRYKDQE